MRDPYKFLLGWPHVRGDEGGGAQRMRAPLWEEADGTGPDRLFNRYRRLRLQALAQALPRRLPATDGPAAV